MNPFECDRQSKYDFTASTVSYFAERYAGKDVSVRFMEWSTDHSTLVPFDSEESDSCSRTDLCMEFTSGVTTTTYNIELKERWGKYVSDYYGEDGKEGWMLNIEKDSVLKHSFGLPLYVNLYPDGKIRLWNLDKVGGEYGKVTKPIHKYTVIDSEVKQQDRYTLMNNQGITIPRIRGKKSDGCWSS